MIAPDASFLIDYLDSEPAAGEFVEGHRKQPLHTPVHAVRSVSRRGLQ